MLDASRPSAAAPAGRVAKFAHVAPPSPDQYPYPAPPDQFAAPTAAMYCGSDQLMSAELPLLQFVVGPLVGIVARSVWTHVPMSPALLMNLYVAPAGGVVTARVAVSSMLFTLTL